ncbi:ankyrin repeat domain-containing protein 13C isoform X1 [Nematolebias whitei]|uniref:ankyrin repeat domain-containing protein 13C isoform X1 n=1 Tax=Nematolebias whitei TaxID=451745 RepID=UPI0018972169|nr:ankyrin repeat domain-containing protein 13C isoform X1 [Nematolebias whitei]XP_037537575.1 ankyrin repeat domain-containing protein 13C isoform X1 [Nematolebias whitei]
MTGEKIRTSRKDHKKTNKNQAIMDAYDETSNGTIPNGTGYFKSNKAFHKSVKSSALQEQLNANNINGNAPVVAEDSNKNPIILTSDELEFPVHECVFKGDVRRLSSLIRTNSISQKDVHGNTPLHLAVMLGHKECALLLLAHNAPVKIKNAQGWSPLAEAISYGDRQMITAILRKLKQQSRESVEDKRPKLLKALKELGDFYLEVHWDFQSWVPLLSRMLPSDACKIYKQGINIRLNTTLIDFNDMKCQRGDLSFIFNGDAPPSQSFVVLDNEAEVYQRIHHECSPRSSSKESEMETEEEVDILMSSDVYSATLSTKSITFSRSQIGWLFREDKTERVGNFLADFYSVNGLVLESRKRREHLSEEDILRNKAIMESLSKGGGISEQNFEPVRRQSLTAPTPNTISWEEYVTAEPGKPPHLGRELVCKESKKNFKATVAMSQDFPLGIESLLNVLEVVAPFKHFNKLREFVQMKLPPGFPVKLDIPVFPTITATVTFQEFRYDKFEESIFYIPAEYKEDPNRFPDL